MTQPILDPLEAEIILRAPQQGMHQVYRQLKVFVRRKGIGQAIVTFDGTNVHFAAPEVDVCAPAQGNWPGQARVGMAALMAVISSPPEQDPLVIRVSAGYIHFGPTFSCQCTWQSATQPLIRLPINAGDAALVAVSLRFDSAQIQASGLSTLVNEAEKRLKSRLQSAVQALEQYNVTEASLRELVHQSLTETGILNQLFVTHPAPPSPSDTNSGTPKALLSSAARQPGTQTADAPQTSS